MKKTKPTKKADERFVAYAEGLEIKRPRNAAKTNRRERISTNKKIIARESQSQTLL